MTKRSFVTILSYACCTLHAASTPGAELDSEFSPEKDLLSLHYDHAPDKDDGHSAVADRTILQSKFGMDWIKDHVVAVSGAYGENAEMFNARSNAVMDATWSEGGWLAADADWPQAVAQLAGRWTKILAAGGDVWVKEGGQSDITAEVVKRVQRRWPEIDTSRRIHVVQHSDWNEEQTTDAALQYTKQHTEYIRINDANAYLNIQGGDEAFVSAATEHPVFGTSWQAAFDYYRPENRLDFSDTGELMYILGLGEIGIDEFHRSFLTAPDKAAGEPGATDP